MTKCKLTSYAVPVDPWHAGGQTKAHTQCDTHLVTLDHRPINGMCWLGAIEYLVERLELLETGQGLK